MSLFCHVGPFPSTAGTITVKEVGHTIAHWTFHLREGAKDAINNKHAKTKIICQSRGTTHR